MLAQGRWPRAEPALLEEATSLVVVQVNGKLRARIPVRRGAGEERSSPPRARTPASPRAVGAGSIRKIVHVPDRLLNLVVD